MRGMRGESEYWFNYFNCKMLQKHLMSKKAPVYRKVQLFPDKIDSKDQRRPSPSLGFIPLGNRNRSHSQKDHHSKSAAHYKLAQSQAKLIKKQHEKQNCEDPEKYEGRVRNKNNCLRLKTDQSEIKRTEKIDRSSILSNKPRQNRSISKGSTYSRAKSRNPKQNAKFQERLQRVKQFTIVREVFSDLQLEAIFNELEIAGVTEVRWVLIIIDRAYDLLKHCEERQRDGQILRD